MCLIALQKLIIPTVYVSNFKLQIMKYIIFIKISDASLNIAVYHWNFNSDGNCPRIHSCDTHLQRYKMDFVPKIKLKNIKERKKVSHHCEEWNDKWIVSTLLKQHLLPSSSTLTMEILVVEMSRNHQKKRNFHP